jgi:hydrogenase maturation protease
MAGSPSRVLVLGYGNPAREDDALGPMVAERISEMGIDGVDVDCDYQLAVEDAHAVAEHDAVVFVDAAVEGPEPFSWRKLEPPGEHSGVAAGVESFSTHALSSAGVLALARELFHSRAPAYELGIRGYSFRMFCEKATAQAERNSALALRFLARKLRAGRIAGSRPTGGKS